MRLQWWKDVIHQMYTTGGTPSGHPVASFLESAVHKHGLSRRWFDRVLEARWRELEEEQPLTVAELERNCDHSNASLILLTLECLGYGPKDDPNGIHVGMDIAAQHLGRAVGLCNLLRGTAVHASKNRLYIPVETLKKYDADARFIMSGPPSKDGAEAHKKQTDAACRAVRDIAERAEAHLSTARVLYEGKALSKDFDVDTPLTAAPSGARCAFLPAVRSARYLTVLKECGYDLHHPTLWPHHESDSLIQFQLRMVGSSFGLISPFAR
jgi:NADH dehydrogenase [ubiquinone] 1 alpha subcomplex assembly factor 6